MPQYNAILYDVQDGLATLTINRPAARNGMTREMLRETFECLSAAERDRSLRVLMLTGAGGFFCPGADLQDRAEDPGAGDDNDSVRFYHVARLLHEMPAVTVAAINGACAGAGLGWACGADIRVAARSAVFNTAFLGVAVAGDMGLPWSLPRLIGSAKARELSFLSEKFSADEALRIGLVARVWDDAVFRDEALKLARGIAARGPLALPVLKDHYTAAERMSFRDYVDLETQHHRRIMATEDTREAMRAFLQKRTPEFKGR